MSMNHNELWILSSRIFGRGKTSPWTRMNATWQKACCSYSQFSNIETSLFCFNKKGKLQVNAYLILIKTGVGSNAYGQLFSD